MATRRVPQDYPSVQAAVDAAAAGDTITVYASYTAGETVTVTVDNLVFNGSSQASIALALSGVGIIHIGGTLSFSVTSDADGATIYGSVGKNTITGGEGADRIFAGLGDTVHANGGNDVISVSGKPVLIDGGEGRDTLNVTGNTTFDAGSIIGIEQINVANNVLAFFDALDTGLTVRSLSQAGGHSTIRGSSGDDVFTDGAGADRYVGNGGTDTVSYSAATAGVTANLAAPGGNTGWAAGDTYATIENLTGSNFADILTGNSAANVIDGGGGDDTIRGGRGDTLYGGKGGDTFVIDGAGLGVPLSINGGAPDLLPRDDGSNEIRVVGNTHFTSASNIVNVFELFVADGITADFGGVTGQNFYQFHSQSIAGSASSITTRTNVLTGTTFDGGLGADTLIGGLGDDTFYLHAMPTLIDGGGGGINTAYLYVSMTLDAAHAKNIDNFYLQAGTGLDLSAYGNQSFVTVQAFGGKSAGPSDIVGSAAANIISEGACGGTVTGGGGADTIYVFAGTNANATTLVYHAGDTGIVSGGIDAVGGFRTGRDKIEIDGITPSATRYAETTIATNSFDDAKAAASGLMADGSKDVAFIATSGSSGFLFWNATPGHTAPNAGIELYGGTSLSFFAASDLTSPSL